MKVQLILGNPASEKTKEAIQKGLKRIEKYRAQFVALTMAKAFVFSQSAGRCSAAEHTSNWR